MIEGLNSDMLGEMFKQLNTDGMKQLRLASKKLKDAVDNSAELKKRKAVLDNLNAISPKLAFIATSVRAFNADAEKFDEKVGPYIKKFKAKPKVDRDIANKAKIMKAYIGQCRKEFATVAQQLIILKANNIEAANQTMELIKKFEDKDAETFEKNVGLQMKDMLQYRKQYASLKTKIDEATDLVMNCGNSLAALHDKAAEIVKSAT